MSDVISRQDAIIAISEFVTSMSVCESVDECHGMKRMQGMAVRALWDLPSAERTGRWTHVYDENEKLFFRNKWVCSACGNSNTYGMSDFCPWCGAMMENSTRRTMEAKDGE